MMLLFCPCKFYGQCCAPGGPTIGTLSPGTVWENNLKVLSFYQYGYSSGYKSGTTNSSFDYINNGNYKFLGLLASYGLTENLTLSLETGYYFSKKQKYNLDIEDNVLEGFGLTELTVLPKYKVFNSLTNGIDLSLGIGVKIPYSTNFQQVNNVVLPIDVQPSTNAYGFISDVYLNYPIIKYDFQMMLINRIIINASTDYNGIAFLNGNRIFSSAVFLYSPLDELGALIEFKHEFKAHDEREDKIINSSGYNILYLSPQFIYIYDELIQASLLFEYPIYENYNGTQLSLDYNISIAITYNFLF